MYSIDLTQISLNEFKEILTTIDLLPGRRMLLNGLDEFIECLKHNGITHLAELQKVLKDKKRYSELAEVWAVDMDYLTVLNREINSYISKPLPLSELDIFSEAELERLVACKLKTTRDLYEQCLSRSVRKIFANRLSMPEERLVSALELIDLLRINGVGPVYAKILRAIGIRNMTDYLNSDSQDLLARYQQANKENEFTKAHLGIKDIEYCKRFCAKLTNDIEW